MIEDDDATSSASDSGHELVHKPRSSKRLVMDGPSLTSRRSTYYQRKDEIQTLQDEVKRLQAELQAYTSRDAPQTTSLLDALQLNAVLAHGVQSSHHAFAGMQSMASAYSLAMVHSRGMVPLQDHHIHLSTDHAEREAVLNAMFESKIHSAAQFLTERTQFMDLNVAQKQSEEFELPDGTICAVVLDVVPFTSGHSLTQVYEALMFFIDNQEMSISEQLGMLTIRESDEQKDAARFRQIRILSSPPEGGVQMESNIVTFATCRSPASNSPAYAVAAIDSVDQDDLYPYRPELCVRKEFTGAVTLTELPSTTESGKPTIAMARWSYVRMLPPAFAISEDAQIAARRGMLQWCDVIPKVIKERLSITPVGA